VTQQASRRRRVARASCVGLLVAILTGCGASSHVAAPLAAPPPVTTDDDPPTFVPPPSERARTGPPTGAPLRGRDDEARRLVLRFLEALRDRSTATLEAVLAEPVSRSGGVIARASLIAGLQRAAEADGLARAPDLSALFDLSATTVAPLSVSRDLRRRPPRYRPDDLLVRIPVQGGVGNRRLNDLVFVRLGTAELVVRLGAEPCIIGL
jgi:hypothetical protein